MSLHELETKRSIAPARAPNTLFRGTINTTPVGLDDMVYVTIAAAGETHRFGPCRWMPRGMEMPQEGDECVVQLDNRQQFWITSWWPLNRPTKFTFPDGSAALPGITPVDDPDTGIYSDAGNSNVLRWALAGVQKMNLVAGGLNLISGIFDAPAITESARRVFSRAIAGAQGNVSTGVAITEVDLQTHAIPAGTFPATGGWVIDIVAMGTCSGVNNTKTMRLKFGATTLATITLIAAATDTWTFRATIRGTGSANSQKTLCEIMTSASNITARCNQVDAAEVMSGAVVIKTTGETPNASDEITSKVLDVRYSPS